MKNIDLACLNGVPFLSTECQPIDFAIDLEIDLGIDLATDLARIHPIPRWLPLEI